MLQEHQEKSRLTDREFADARAETLKKEVVSSETQAKTGLVAWTINVLLTISLILVALIIYIVIIRQKTQSLTTDVHAAAILTDEVEHLPAPAWKAFPLSLPYSGTVNIAIRVVRGDPIDVLLTTPDQLDILTNPEWGNLKVLGDFSATKTKTYAQTGRLAKGGYYLVVRDMSVGIPTSSASDISVKVQLNP